MRTHKRLGMIVGAAFVALALATPASADWYIFLELASAEPANAALIGGNISTDDGAGTETNSLLSAEIGANFSGTIAGGFEALGGIVGLAYTTSSGDATSASVTLNDFTSPTTILDESMGGREFDPEVGTASVFGDIERSTIDVVYIRLMNPGDDKVTTHWTFGLRSATYEEMIIVNASGDDAGGGNAQTLVENYLLDVDALGVVFGGGAEVELGKNFSIYGNLSTSVLMSDTDESIISVENFDSESLFDTRDGAGMIWDVAVGARVFKREKVQIGIEYQLSSWQGLVGRQVLGADDISDNHAATRDSVAFHGIAVNALFRLGS